MNTAVMSMIAKKAGPILSPKVSRQKLVLKKNSPHILFGLGIAGTVTSTVLACRATLRLPDTLEEIEQDVAKIRSLREANEKISENDPDDLALSTREINRDAVAVYGKAVYKLGRLYGPSAAISIVSIAALSGSHVALSRRNTALMAAYAAVAKAYDDYRERVIQELGKERELDIYHAKVGTGSELGLDEDTCIVDPNSWSPYARFFDEGSPHWEKNAEFNRLYVQCQQNYANEKLRAQGHLFLNEVYDMLGIERSSAGSVVGWVIGSNGDNYVDFGMYDAYNAHFINGQERTILLDFNVDGVIYDKI